MNGAQFWNNCKPKIDRGLTTFTQIHTTAHKNGHMRTHVADVVMGGVRTKIEDTFTDMTHTLFTHKITLKLTHCDA